MPTGALIGGMLLAIAVAQPAPRPIPEIRGVVISDGNRVVGGATVEVFMPETPAQRRGRWASPKPRRVAVATSSTDARGRFAVAAGSAVVDVQVTARGYAPTGVRAADAEDVGAILLRAAEARQGRVTAGGKPVPAATVVWVGAGEHVAITDESGRYSVPDPIGWAERVSVIHPEYEPIDDDVKSVDRALVRRAPKGGQITVRNGATIAGLFIDADSRVPVAGAEIELTIGPGNPFSEIAFTDARGRFAFSGLRPGRYRLATARPGYAMTGDFISVGAGQRASRNLFARRTATVIATAIDAAKKPVPGVVATAVAGKRSAMSRSAFGAQGTCCLSDDEGRVVVRNVDTAAGIRLDAAKSGFPRAKSALLTLERGERREGIVLSMTRGLVIGGTISSAGGDVLSGVDVHVDDVPDAIASSDRDGRFSIAVMPGRYHLAFRKAGYATTHLRDLQLAADTRPLAVVLVPGAGVSGRVTQGGAGAPNVTVAISTPDGEVTTTTRSDGSFELSDLAPGRTTLIAWRAGGTSRAFESVIAPADDVVIALPDERRIRGRVIDGKSREPVTAFQAGLGTVRRGADVIMATGPQLQSFSSDEGLFELSASPGPVQLVIVAPGYATARLSSLTVEEERDLDDVEVVLFGGVKLIGTVKSTAGAPLADAHIRMEVSAPTGLMKLPYEGSGRSDPDGEYAIDALPEGESSFFVSREGYLPQRQSVALAGSETRLDFTLRPGARLAGTVVDHSGAPIADAAVRTTGISAQTDASGAFLLEGLAPGRYSVTASKSGYADATLRDVDVAGATPVRLVLNAGGTIHGHVAGLPNATNATVFVSSEGGPLLTGPVSAARDYRVDNVPAGAARVWSRVGGAISDGRTSAVESVTIADGERREVELRFEPNATIEGQVTWNGEVLPGAAVAFDPLFGLVSTTARTYADASGRYEVSGLENGLYRIVVRDPRRAGSFRFEYEVRGSATYELAVRAGALRGKVVDHANSRPLGNAVVELRSAGEPEVYGARTDEQGGFVVDNVPAGTWMVTATKPRYSGPPLEVTIGESGTAGITVRLTQTGGVVATVADALRGEPLSFGARVIDQSGRTIHDDLYRAGGVPEPRELPLPPGIYRITIGAPAHAAQTITARAPSTVSVFLNRGGTIVLRSDSGEARRGRLVLQDGSDYLLSGSRDGSFVVDPAPFSTTLPNVPPGRVMLQLLDARRVLLREIVLNVVEGETAEVKF